MKIKIFTDGGSRGNPGPAAIGVVVFEQEKTLYECSEYIGEATNNEAEYQAFIQSAQWVAKLCHERSIEEVEWYLDSKLVVEQLLKHWKIKEPRMRKLAEVAWRELENLPCRYSIAHIPRAKNVEADALVNQALDARI